MSDLNMNSGSNFKAQGNYLIILIINALIFFALYTYGFFAKGYGFIPCLSGFIITTIFATIGIIIGNVIRKFTIPDAIITNGGIYDILRAKIFWAIGPQIVGWVVGALLAGAILKSLGLDPLQNIEIKKIESSAPVATQEANAITVTNSNDIEEFTCEEVQNYTNFILEYKNEHDRMYARPKDEFQSDYEYNAQFSKEDDNIRKQLMMKYRLSDNKTFRVTNKTSTCGFYFKNEYRSYGALRYNVDLHELEFYGEIFNGYVKLATPNSWKNNVDFSYGYAIKSVDFGGIIKSRKRNDAYVFDVSVDDAKKIKSELNLPSINTDLLSSLNLDFSYIVDVKIIGEKIDLTISRIVIRYNLAQSRDIKQNNPIPPENLDNIETIMQPPADKNLNNNQNQHKDLKDINRPIQKQTLSASFDCTKASMPAEKLICSSQQLAEADIELANIYKQAMQLVGDKQTLIKEQRAWLQERNKCVDENCIINSYGKRTEELIILIENKN